MADTVQQIMERMTVPLQDMESNGIFSHEEINSIIRKRRNMEYSLNSYSKTLQDYLAVIEYEMNLESLRKLRKKKLGVFKALDSDNSIVGRIIYTFERMVRKYSGDLNVWLKYVEYCESVSNENRLAGLYPRILQLHPRAESVWVKAANWEMSRGNYNNARLLLQRALRINHSSKLLWKEYFRFELVYINVVEERRRILGLPSLKDRLLGESKDATLKELVDEADVKADEKESNETVIPEEVTDLELLDEESPSKPMELPDSEEDQREVELETKKNAEVDQLIHENSDAMQAEFLRGAIPKVIYKHAIAACNDPLLAVDLLRISYELSNVFVEQFIIQSILDESPRDLNVWSELISYPITRINDELSVTEPDQLLEKRRNRDIEESCQMAKQLSNQMIESLKGEVPNQSIFATIIKALTVASKALSVTGNGDVLNQTVEEFYAEAEEMKMVDSQVIAEMLKFYASQGRMEDCMKCLKSHQELLLAEIGSFLSTIAMIISVANRADYLIRDTFDVKDIPQFIISLFTAGIRRFQDSAKKEEILQIYIRYLKYLISIQYNRDLIEQVFMAAFKVIPELNGPVFLLYLTFCSDHGMECLRKAIDFGLNHEVLIPLNSDVLEECIDYEKRLLASSLNEQEKKITIGRIERLYDVFCVRYSQNPDVWLEYMEFERLHDGYQNIQVISNRAYHVIKDTSTFEEKFHLFQLHSHL